MFASLARNIIITGIAYSVISVVGLVLAPFLIATYGLAGYGQILLARLFQPSSSFAFLDLGIADNVTRAVAGARHDGKWDEAASAVSLLVVMALAVSALFAIFMVATAWAMPVWMDIAPDQRAGFTRVMLVTAALQPALFLSLVFEGTLKGFERFKKLRLCEVTSALVYGGLALAFGLSGRGPNWVAFGLLVALSVRFLMVAGFALALLRAEGVRPTLWSPASRATVFRWSRIMLANRLLGALQAQIASPLIGLLLGPAAVGAFDAVCRLPRFVKSILSLLSTTVLPVSAGLKARADTDSLRRLGNYGILAALTISAPPILFGMAYSEALLHFWIGDAVTAFWGWQSAMFVATLLNVTLSFGGAILLADAAASAALTRLSAWQIGLQVILSLALLPMLHEWAFVLGQVVAATLVFPLQFAEIRRRLDLGDRILRQALLLAGFVGLAALALRLLLPAPGLAGLGALALGYGLLVWGLLPWVLLGRSERSGLFARLKARAPLWPGRSGLGYKDTPDVLKGGANEAPPGGHGME